LRTHSVREQPMSIIDRPDALAATAVENGMVQPG
jgi:hypothetical protein